MNLSDHITALLMEAGWTVDRRVAIDLYVRELETYGYSVSPLVRMFLMSFGGLIIDRKVKTKYGMLRLYTHFDPLRAMKDVEELESCMNRIQHPLCIIGEKDNNEITLLMDASGNVYGCCEDRLFFYGEDGEQALEQLFSDDLYKLPAERAERG